MSGELLADSTARLVIEQRPAAAGTAVVGVRIADVAPPGVSAATVDVEFDPMVLQPDNCVADAARRFDTALCNAHFEVDGVAPDRVRVTAIDATGETGSLELASITFAIVDPSTPSTEVRLTPTTFAAPDGAKVPVVAEAASISLGSASTTPAPSPAPHSPTPSGATPGSTRQLPAPTVTATPEDPAGTTLAPALSSAVEARVIAPPDTGSAGLLDVTERPLCPASLERQIGPSPP